MYWSLKMIHMYDSSKPMSRTSMAASSQTQLESSRIRKKKKKKTRKKKQRVLATTYSRKGNMHGGVTEERQMARSIEHTNCRKEEEEACIGQFWQHTIQSKKRRQHGGQQHTRCSIEYTIYQKAIPGLGYHLIQQQRQQKFILGLGPLCGSWPTNA